jgi:site-specific DNA recombinase
MDTSHSDDYVAYLRKSNGRKPIPRQRALTTAHVQGLGGRIIAEFKDADSTAFRKIGETAPERKDFARMLVMLKANPGLGVAAYHADRITRSPEDTEAIIQVCAAGRNPVETHSGGRYELWTATGRKRLRDDATAAAFEVDHNRERVLDGRLEVARQGRWLGGKRPFGWELDRMPMMDGEPLLDDDGNPVRGILRLVPREAEAIAQAHRDVLDGVSLAAIARAWNKDGITTSLGAEWHAAEVGRVLRRARNAGLMEYQGEITGKASWPAIVDETTWKAVRAILDDPGRKTTPGPSRRHLLSFLARCDVCSGPVIVTGNRGGRLVYRCRKDTRGHVARDVAHVDDLVSRVVIKRLNKPDAADLLSKDTSQQRAALLHEQAGVEAMMREENDLRKRKLLTAQEFAESRTEHLADLERIKGQLAELTHGDVLAPLIVRLREEAPDDFDGQLVIWNDYPLDRRRGVIAALIDIRIKPTTKGRPKGWQPGKPYFDPRSVKINWRKKRSSTEGDAE